MTWREMAACADIDPEIFFPHAGRPRGYVTKESKALAMAMCAGCMVTTPCLDYALTMPGSQDFGIWGGTTANQRDKMRRNQHQPLPSRRTLQEAARV